MDSWAGGMEKTKRNARRRTTLHVAAIRQTSKVVSIGREKEPYWIGKATGYSADTGDSGRGADAQAGSESVSFFPAGGAGANRESVAHGDGANGGCDGVQIRVCHCAAERDVVGNGGGAGVEKANGEGEEA
jgi:hypothetical protein